MTYLSCFSSNHKLVISSNTQEHFTLLANIRIRITRHYTLTQRMIIFVFLTLTARPALQYFNWVVSCSGFQTSDTILFVHMLNLCWSFCLQKTISVTSDTLYLIFFVMKELKENVSTFTLQFLPRKVLSLPHVSFCLTQYQLCLFYILSCLTLCIILCHAQY